MKDRSPKISLEKSEIQGRNVKLGSNIMLVGKKLGEVDVIGNRCIDYLAMYDGTGNKCELVSWRTALQESETLFRQIVRWNVKE